MRNKLLALATALLCSASHSGEVARVPTVSQTGAYILFDEVKVDEETFCINGSLKALYKDPRVEVPGCWLVVGDTLHIQFVDGDRHKYPAADFFPHMKKQQQKPNSI